MRFFETPEMNITMFDVENIVTESVTPPAKENAVKAAETALYNADVQEVLQITF